MSHWSSTPEGRQRLSDLAKRRWSKNGDLRSPEVSRRRKEGIKRAQSMRKQKRPYTRKSPTSVIHVPSKEEVRASAERQLIELTAASVLGHVTATIESYARSARLPSAVVAERVAEILLRSTGR